MFVKFQSQIMWIVMQRDKGLYRRCYGQEFGLIAWCWNMNFESIMCQGELRDEHGPALRARTLDIVSRLVVVSGKPDAIGVGEGEFVKFGSSDSKNSAPNLVKLPNQPIAIRSRFGLKSECPYALHGWIALDQ